MLAERVIPITERFQKIIKSALVKKADQFKYLRRISKILGAGNACFYSIYKKYFIQGEENYEVVEQSYFTPSDFLVVGKILSL